MKKSMDLLESALTTAISKTMESMTFEEVEVVLEDTRYPEDESNYCWSTLPVLSPVNGALILEISLENAEPLIKNVYGEVSEEIINEASINDLLAEILNTIAGRFMSALLPSDQEFELGLPKTGRGSLTEPERKVTSISFSVGGYIMTVTVIGAEFQDFIKNREIVT